MRQSMDGFLLHWLCKTTNRTIFDITGKNRKCSDYEWKAAYRCLRWLALYHNKFFHLKHVRSCLHFHVSPTYFCSGSIFVPSLAGVILFSCPVGDCLPYFVGSLSCLRTIGSYFSLEVSRISPCWILQILFNYLQLCCGHRCRPTALERSPG